jgi:hypothetical protein
MANKDGPEQPPESVRKPIQPIRHYDIVSGEFNVILSCEPAGKQP